MNKLTFYSAIFAAALFNAQAENRGNLGDGYIPMGNDNLMQEIPRYYRCKKMEETLSMCGSNNVKSGRLKKIKSRKKTRRI